MMQKNYLESTSTKMDIQGRNIQEISKYDLADTYGWTIFAEMMIQLIQHTARINNSSSNIIANAYSLMNPNYLQIVDGTWSP